MTLPDGKRRPADPPKADAALRAPEVARLFREHNRSLVLYLAARFKDVQSARETRARFDQLAEFDELFIEPSAERTLIAREELVHLGRIVAELAEKYQQAFRLHRLEDYSFSEIALQIGIKERMVRRYVTNTLVYLRLRRAGVSSADAWRQVHA